MIWKTRRGFLDLSHRAQVMGILNATPDSFSDGGAHLHLQAALSHAREMIAEGATIIDIGGESTRPGAAPVSAQEEMARTLPIITALRQEWDGLISIDTSKAAVAKAALEAGTDIVNDVSGLMADPEMPAICAASGCGVVVMHMQGNPQTMQKAPHYSDVVAEVQAFFHERKNALIAAGIHPSALCFDPGIGFGKTLEHNLTLLRNLGDLTISDHPLLLGVSRKTLIGKILASDDLKAREWPTVAITANAREQGVMLHRVHSVRQNVEALRMIEAILSARKEALEIS
ncbi:MAG: dihydropteroate synthase [Akkermansiaceae bacterium]|nr:dihydropteroate synthase [Akkermansiaceae bacterium]